MTTTQQQLADLTQAVADYTNEAAELNDRCETAVVESEKNAATAKSEADKSVQNNAESGSHAARSEAAADRADIISGLETVRDALRESVVPIPDFQMELTENILIQHGKGTPVMMDVSPANDGSVMRAVPYLYQGDFTRAARATYQDKNTGQLKIAEINEPRFEKDGLLIEGTSTKPQPV